ncbi:MAG: hypothetical protein IKF80_07690, partial [Erysipelotrichaceae bacterium]|nr:hypothetical protein [Erysipelotrichaceae bacterium]
MGLKIAVALAGSLSTPQGAVTMSNVENVKDKLKDLKAAGHIEIFHDGKIIDVTWGQGHLGELYQAQDYNPDYKNWSKMPLPFIPQRYQIKIREGTDYKTGRKTGKSDVYAVKQLKIIDECFDKADVIYSGVDADREGSLIFSYVCRLLNKNSIPYKRMNIDSTTQAGLKKAYDDAFDGSQEKGLVFAGNCRSIADWVVGANLTAAATLKYSGALNIPLVSIGRLQTAVLNLIVEREKAIKNFVSKPFWQIKGTFATDSGETYEGITDRYEDINLCNGALSALKGTGIITKCEKKDVKREVPLLFNSADMYRTANEAFGLSAARTLEIMQSLYDKGFISYPRTDSRHLPDDMKTNVDIYLNNLKSHPVYGKWIKEDRKYTKRHFDTTKVESHFALCITEKVPGSLSDDEQKIYDLIAKSIIRTIYDDAILERTSVETTDNGVVFKSSGSIVKYPGWMVVADATVKDVLLPALAESQVVSGQYEQKEGKTEPPKRYTEASLLTAMQTCSKEIDDAKLKAMLKDKNNGGIGRPSTQPNIIKTVIDRYCHMEKKSIVPTENAMALMEMFPVEDLKSPEMTAEWETKLDQVEKLKIPPGAFMSEINDCICKWCSEVAGAAIT